MFKTKDAQLTASFSLKSRPALTVKGVINKDCLEPTNSESIHQLILVDFKGEKSANPTLSHATPLEQSPQPGDNTTQPQTDTIPLLTPSLTCSKPNIAFLKHCPCSPLPPYSFSPNISQNRLKGPH
ncbi:hypothetical protein C0995_016089 [Termitomyces sp. Mi166|nr:hypothetical protein C0995_016089 [Termitomyces sp. Mi166\